jgi:hypothetical protein
LSSKKKIKRKESHGKSFVMTMASRGWGKISGDNPKWAVKNNIIFKNK